MLAITKEMSLTSSEFRSSKCFVRRFSHQCTFCKVCSIPVSLALSVAEVKAVFAVCVLWEKKG